MPEPDNTVYVVHCIDAEGPLYADLSGILGNLEDILKIEVPDHFQKTFDKVRAGALNLDGNVDIARSLLDNHRNTYMGDWAQLDTMLDNATSAADFTSITWAPTNANARSRDCSAKWRCAAITSSPLSTWA